MDEDTKLLMERIEKFMLSNNLFQEVYRLFVEASLKTGKQNKVAKTIIYDLAEFISIIGITFDMVIQISGQDHYAIIAHGNSEYLLKELQIIIKTLEDQQTPIPDAKEYL